MKDTNNVNTKMYWLHAITPAHVGTGAGAGFIDLPIMREKTTDWPLIPGSAIKGVRRDQFEQHAPIKDKNEILRLAFGQAENGEEPGSNSGAVVFTDARLLCLPVASYYGTFAWVTSPMALRRARRDADLAGVGLGNLPEASCGAPPKEISLVPGVSGADRSVLLAASGENRVYLTDLDLDTQPSDVAAKWATAIAEAVFPPGEWRKEFPKRFVVVPDNTFNYLSRTACEVQARVRIDSETKTVAAGQLWYEEALPAESILCGLVWCDRVFAKKSGAFTQRQLLDAICGEPLSLQIGGKATVGRGRMRCLFTN